MQQKILPYTSVFIKLLRGPLDYTDKTTWEKLLLYKAELPAFLQQLGLRLILHEEDGYAYLLHVNPEEEDASVSWIIRRALTYEESIMLVLLREMMAEFETDDHEIADEQRFRIKKIIKARVDAEELDSFYQQLKQHKEKLQKESNP